LRQDILESGLDRPRLFPVRLAIFRRSQDFQARAYDSGRQQQKNKAMRAASCPTVIDEFTAAELSRRGLKFMEEQT
jgi:hypothetical protein